MERMATNVPTRGKKAKLGGKPRGQAPLLTKGLQAKARIIAVAEALFTKQGIDGASMRDIAAAAKMQPASMYYYFESKEELVWAVWEKGGLELLNRLNDALAVETDPWRRIEAACVAHVAGLLDWRRANQILFILPPWQYPPSIKARVIALRNVYEKVFVDLIEDLPLRKNLDRRYMRLTLIGALSWPLFWYKKGGDTPATIAKTILAMLRCGVDDV